MHTTRFGWMALATFFVAGSVACFGIAIEHAQAQFVNPLPPPPPPIFNPSTPSTVPQAPETPVSPGMPSALPGSAVISPSVESPPSAVVHSHRRQVTPATGTSNVAKARAGRHGPRRYHRNWSRGSYTGAGRVSGPSYYPFGYSAFGPFGYSPFGYDRGPYCGWRREWDGYWTPPTCF